MSEFASVREYVERLAAELRGRGLAVTVHGPTLTASNAAVGGWTAGGDRLNPGLSQSVVLRAGPDGPDWYWLWPPLRTTDDVSDEAPDAEFLCRGKDVPTAAERIARVVSLAERA